jgi:hypothetical protein
MFLSYRHPEEREARLEGSTARLVAVHPSRLAQWRNCAARLAPPATKAKPLRGDGGESLGSADHIGDKLSLIADCFTSHVSALAIGIA